MGLNICKGLNLPFTRTPQERAVEGLERKRKQEEAIKEKAGQLIGAVRGSGLTKFAGGVGGSIAGGRAGAAAGTAIAGPVGGAVGGVALITASGQALADLGNFLAGGQQNQDTRDNVLRS